MVQVHLGAPVKFSAILTVTQTTQNFIVPLESNGQRLDIFLSEKLAITRSQAQKLIIQKQVTINNHEPKKAGERIGTDDAIQIKPHLPSPSKNAPQLNNQKKPDKISSPARGGLKGGRSIRILAETPDYLIVDKPTGLLTHAVEHQKDADSVADQLLKKYPEISSVGEDKTRPGIVHRLDKEASGLLVIARTQKMFNHLKEQFKHRTVDKEYLVLVHGKLAREEGIIDFPIARSGNVDRMAAIPKLENGHLTDEGKEALTEFVVEKYFVNFTLLRVKIHTGRTHQIRAHMLAYNHPVVGDPLYIQKKRKRTWDEKLGRLFLHCTKLGFKDLEGLPQEFESPLPPELEEFLTIVP